MKKFIAMGMVALFTLASVSGFCQQKKPQFMWNKETMTALGISAEVQEKINAVKKDSDAELKKLKDNSTMSEDEKKEEMKKLRKQRMENIEALLTPEQKAKAAEMRKEMKG